MCINEDWEYAITQFKLLHKNILFPNYKIQNILKV